MFKKLKSCNFDDQYQFKKEHFAVIKLEYLQIGEQ